MKRVASAKEKVRRYRNRLAEFGVRSERVDLADGLVDRAEDEMDRDYRESMEFIRQSLK